ncbi:hypothetical protein PCASD_13276 [Puccinia coronata f. sp. avenae]|uniref:Uncharacterized protein n=1 Tax=Puccinia coronata f. sp. avenae TaxID=200324 RepID=A0A2N5T3I7_9BASI|nr:hypothetical protein PCASD_13276 [Puccinia coronata f. sp. avenae]
MEWAGYVVTNGRRPLNDPDQISVKLPSTVPIETSHINPTDGWPENPLLCIRKLAAQISQLMRKTDIKVLSGQPITYHE